MMYSVPYRVWTDYMYDVRADSLGEAIAIAEKRHQESGGQSDDEYSDEMVIEDEIHEWEAEEGDKPQTHANSVGGDKD